jgi:hypothetical protein
VQKLIGVDLKPMNYSPSTHYRAVEFAPDRWHVISPSGIPLYNDSRDGDDAPLVFDEDHAYDCAERMNDHPQDCDS